MPPTRARVSPVAQHNPLAKVTTPTPIGKKGKASGTASRQDQNGNSKISSAFPVIPKQHAHSPIPENADSPMDADFAVDDDLDRILSELKASQLEAFSESPQRAEAGPSRPSGMSTRYDSGVGTSETDNSLSASVGDSMDGLDDDFFDNYEGLAAAMASTQGNTPSTTPSSSSGIPPGLVPFIGKPKVGQEAISSKNVHVTPDFTAKSCRVYRKFRADHFLWLYIPPDHISKSDRVSRWLNLTIDRDDDRRGPMKFTFLCSSESRLKNRAVCFFSPYDGITHMDVLRGFGDLDSVYYKGGIGKYVARLSLSWSDAQPTIDLEDHEVVHIEDYLVNREWGSLSKVYSDGCGLITELAADRVRTSLGLDYVPSVFQIRFGGAKGLLAVWSDAEIQRVTKDKYSPLAAIYLRDSQRKYQAPDERTLEVCAWSQRSHKPARLQRSVIRVLRCLGVKLEKIGKLLQDELDRLKAHLNSEAGAIQWLEGMKVDLHGPVADGRANALRKLKAGHPITEPKLQSELQALMKSSLSRLREKLSIPVPQSANLFGIVDESGLLKPDEVTAYVSGVGYIDGWVWVVRAPCTHPGDLRFVKAVKPIRPNNLHNCLIFPRQGDQPLPDMLSGGDLDGDKYIICWDPELQKGINAEPNPRPARATAKAPSSKKKLDLIAFQKECFKYSLTNFEIGKTSKAWEACAEDYLLGPRSEYCRALSERYEICLDASKGMLEVPAWPLEEKKPKGPRRKNLGPVTLLQKCIPEGFDAEVTSVKRDEDLVYEEESATWKEGKNLFLELRKELRQEMARYQKKATGPNRPINNIAAMDPEGVKTESQKYKDKEFSLFIEEKLEHWRQVHFQMSSPRDSEPMRILASGFYSAAYTRGTTGIDTNDLRLAWIAAEHLNGLKCQWMTIRAASHVVYLAPPVSTFRSEEVMSIEHEDDEEYY